MGCDVPQPQLYIFSQRNGSVHLLAAVFAVHLEQDCLLLKPFFYLFWGKIFRWADGFLLGLDAIAVVVVAHGGEVQRLRRVLGDLEQAVLNAREAFAEFVVKQESGLPKCMQEQLDGIRLIQQRYAWFLDGIFKGKTFEKKKGQRKEPLAQQIYSRGYEAFVSGVSLGIDPEVDAPNVKAQYRVRGEGDKAEIVEEMYFDRLLDFVYVEFMKGLQRGFVPKRCANCGRWFLQMPGATYSYCNEPAPGQPNKTCREIGATNSFRSKVKNNDVWQVHQRAYKKYFARVRKGTMSKADFEVWSREAERLRDEALSAYARAETEKNRQRIAEELRKSMNRL